MRAGTYGAPELADAKVRVVDRLAPLLAHDAHADVGCLRGTQQIWHRGCSAARLVGTCWHAPAPWAAAHRMLGSSYVHRLGAGLRAWIMATSLAPSPMASMRPACFFIWRLYQRMSPLLPPSACAARQDSARHPQGAGPDSGSSLGWTP